MEPDSPEPSMEDILASIKRIIAEDGDATPPAKPRRQPISFADIAGAPDLPAEGGAATEPAAEGGPAEEVLELTSALDAPEAEAARSRSPQGAEPSPPSLVSDGAAVASRQALAALSAMIVTPSQEADNSLEGLVREMLRPLLKEWLDASLPDIVERLVAAEISRITARGA